MSVYNLAFIEGLLLAALQALKVAYDRCPAYVREGSQAEVIKSAIVNGESQLLMVRALVRDILRASDTANTALTAVTTPVKEL